MSKAAALKELAVKVRQAQLAQLTASDKASVAAASRDLDTAIRGIFELHLKLVEVPPGPLRDVVKEIAPYFEARQERWYGADGDVVGTFDGSLIKHVAAAGVAHNVVVDEAHRSHVVSK